MATGDESIYFRIMARLMPRARAFRFWHDQESETFGRQFRSQLRQFFNGIARSVITDARVFLDAVWLDLWPGSTTQLDFWEAQFGLASAGLTDPQRVVRLDAAWKALGGQSPRYIQDILQASGFDVYLHEFWEPGSLPARVVRDPRVYLTDGGPKGTTLAGEYEPAVAGGVMNAGEADAVAGDTNDPLGFPLVNLIRTTTTIFLGAGEASMSAGEPIATSSGQPLSFTQGQVEYLVPDDPDRWPFFLYIGGETFPAQADVDNNRRGEFEELCLKLCPGQQWLGMLITYV